MSIKPVIDFLKTNEAVKDLITASMSVGLLRVAGFRFPVAQLSLKNCAFATGLTFAGATIGREVSRMVKDEESSSSRFKECLKSAVLIASSVIAVFVLTQYRPAKHFLSMCTINFDRNQAALLAGFTSISMVACRLLFNGNPSERPGTVKENPGTSV